jgi:hypothetical protein
MFALSVISQEDNSPLDPMQTSNRESTFSIKYFLISLYLQKYFGRSSVPINRYGYLVVKDKLGSYCPQLLFQTP